MLLYIVNIKMKIFTNILDIDLAAETVTITAYPELQAKSVLGGRGLNAFICRRDIKPGVSALSPDNVLIFSCGLLTGTPAPASSRLHVSALSPLTGGLGSSNIGGGFGARLKAAGFQSVILRGKSRRPSLLYIGNGTAELRTAGSLCGLDTRDALKQLNAEFPNSDSITIGPAGENMVPFACIMTDHGHAAGRTGMGAVMGSKLLKAIVVQANVSNQPASASVRQAVRDYANQIVESPRYRQFSQMSNTFVVGWANEMGLLSTHNYRQGTFEGADRLDGRDMLSYVVRRRSCHRCPVHCRAEIRIDHGPFQGTVGERPDLEPIIALGSKCGLDDTEAVLHLHNLCNRLGLDSLSTGSAIAFAMEAVETGALSARDTGLTDLTWGNHSAMASLIHLIARRQGIGAILSEGVARAAEIIGNGSRAFAHHGKGLELTGFDPRGVMATALGYAVSTRGGDYASIYALTETRWSPETCAREFGAPQAANRFSSIGKGRLVRRSALVSAVLDSLGLCKVPAASLVSDFDLKREARLVSVLTGWEVDADTLMTIGERIFNLENLFNVQHGTWKNKDDLPQLFQTTPLRHGPSGKAVVPLEPMIRDFYLAMGWDELGRSTAETLKTLSIED